MLNLVNKTVFIVCFITCITIGNAYSVENKSLSTSNFVRLEYIDDAGNKVSTCSSKKAAYAQSYVSIGVNKLTVNKEDSLLKRIFNKERHAFGVSNLKATYNSQPLSISRVGDAIVLNGKKSSIDMGVQWGLLDRIPWVIKNANIEIKLGYSADSSTKAMIEAFSSVTSAIPDYTISTSLATGFAMTTAIDKLLFGSDRATDLLNASRDLPLLAGQLCEGYYAIFAAEYNDLYEKYYHGNVVWTGNDLEFEGKPINDVSYAVVSVQISDRYYAKVGDFLNDSSRGWSGKYREIQTSLFDIIWAITEEELSEINKSIRKNLLQARTLLTADVNLLQKEKLEIHQYMLNDLDKRIVIAKKRIDSKNMITKLSTARALMSSINANDSVLQPASANISEMLLADPENNLPEVTPNFVPAYMNTIRNIERVISIR